MLKRYCDVCGASGARGMGVLYAITEQSDYGWCPHWYQKDLCATCANQLVELTRLHCKITDAEGK